MSLSHEAAKLASAAGGAPIDKELVAALVVENPEAKAYELADAVVAGNRAKVFDLLDELGRGGQADRPCGDPLDADAALSRHRGRAVARRRCDAGRGGGRDRPQVVTRRRRRWNTRESVASGSGERCVSRLATLELDLRVSAFGDLGRSGDDGRRFVLELAARDLLGLVRQLGRRLAGSVTRHLLARRPESTARSTPGRCACGAVGRRRRGAPSRVARGGRPWLPTLARNVTSMSVASDGSKKRCHRYATRSAAPTRRLGPTRVRRRRRRVRRCARPPAARR